VRLPSFNLNRKRWKNLNRLMTILLAVLTLILARNSSSVVELGAKAKR
jgi:hypothetical protein